MLPVVPCFVNISDGYLSGVKEKVLHQVNLEEESLYYNKAYLTQDRIVNIMRVVFKNVGKRC